MAIQAEILPRKDAGVSACVAVTQRDAGGFPPAELTPLISPASQIQSSETELGVRWWSHSNCSNYVFRGVRNDLTPTATGFVVRSLPHLPKVNYWIVWHRENHSQSLGRFLKNVNRVASDRQ